MSARSCLRGASPVQSGPASSVLPVLCQPGPGSELPARSRLRVASPAQSPSYQPAPASELPAWSSLCGASPVQSASQPGPVCEPSRSCLQACAVQSASHTSPVCEPVSAPARSSLRVIYFSLQLTSWNVDTNGELRNATKIHYISGASRCGARPAQSILMRGTNPVQPPVFPPAPARSSLPTLVVPPGPVCTPAWCQPSPVCSPAHGQPSPVCTPMRCLAGPVSLLSPYAIC